MKFEARIWGTKEKKFLYSGTYTFDDVISVSSFFVSKNDYESLKDEYILSLCTNKRDKAGEMIFTGDILCLESGEHVSYQIVEWNEDTAAFCVRWGLWSNDRSDHLYLVEHAKKIGNIFENPELLKF